MNPNVKYCPVCDDGGDIHPLDQADIYQCSKCGHAFEIKEGKDDCSD